MLKDHTATDLIVRTPLLPLNKLDDLFSDYSIPKLKKMFEDPQLQQALYVASPSLYADYKRSAVNDALWNDPRFISGMLKYLIRASTRCTPFGLFAGLHVAHLSPEKNNVTIKEKVRTRLRLDMDYLSKLYQDICQDSDLTTKLDYFSNNTLFKVLDKWRYVEYRFRHSQRIYQLVTIDDNIVLSGIVKRAAGGISFQELMQEATRFGNTPEEALAYVHDLIRSQVIVSELYPSVSGEEYQTVLFKKLARFDKYKPTIDALEKIMTQSEHDTDAIEQKTGIIKNILSRSFPTAIQENRFIQVDTFKTFIESHVDESILNTIRDSAVVMNKVVAYDRSQTLLEKFKKAFTERYGESEVPLLEALDADLGINYKNAASETEYRTTNPNNMLWDVSARFRLNLYTRALRENRKSVEIQDEELATLKSSGASHAFPESLSFHGNILNDNGQTKLLWQAITGPSALTLIGRFGHLDNSIAEHCQKLAALEEKHYASAIVAEIVHISDGRVGNILTRPHFRKFEIPYLALSQLPQKNQVPAADLFLSVKGNRLVLRSRRLRREVIPRMSNAHNYSVHGLPVYHFLCDLQNQNFRSTLTWSWYFLSQESFLPRVTYKNSIFCPATWNVSSERIEGLKKLDPKMRSEAFNKIVNELDLPNRVLFKEGDNELLLDLTVGACQDILIAYAGKNETLKLTECLFDQRSSIVQNESGAGYTNEVIIPITKILPAANAIAVQPVSTPERNARQNFEPFNEWVYFKVYCGVKSADKLLMYAIAPVCKKLLRKKIIDKWFFIRYADPSAHIRLRLHLAGKQDYNILIGALEKAFAKYLRSRVIWKIEIDTYQRELVRYGKETIDQAEQFFHANSVCVSSLLTLFAKEDTDYLRMIIALWGVHKIYDAFGISVENRILLTRSGEEAFAKEFGLATNKSLVIKIDSDHRSLARDIQFFMGAPMSGKLDAEAIGFAGKCYAEQQMQLSAVVREIKRKSPMLPGHMLASYIHMFVNRLFNTNQRFEELVIYCHLSRFYTSYQARKKYQKVKEHQRQEV